MAEIIYLYCRRCGETLARRGDPYCSSCNLYLCYRAMPYILGMLLMGHAQFRLPYPGGYESEVIEERMEEYPVAWE
jgi:hypothetical protein